MKICISYLFNKLWRVLNKSSFSSAHAISAFDLKGQDTYFRKIITVYFLNSLLMRKNNQPLGIAMQKADLVIDWMNIVVISNLNNFHEFCYIISMWFQTCFLIIFNCSYFSNHFQILTTCQIYLPLRVGWWIKFIFDQSIL